MSRVDEAIRRAAERTEAGNDTSAATVPEPVDLQSESVDELASEPFPLEMAERRRVSRPAPTTLAPRPTSAPVDVSRTAPAAIPHPLPQAEPHPVSLFERMDGALAEKVVADENMDAVSREQYRRLAATLHHLQSANGLKVVMIASAVPGEGKTLTAANLGLTFSESYKRNVLVIDGDLRRPGLHRIFGTDNTSGLTDGLSAIVERKVPVHRVSERLSLLPGGHPNSDPMAGLTSDRMRRLLSEARDAFDWIIIDTPPVAVLPDANLLSAMVDGTVLVVRAGSTDYTLVKRAVEAIGRQRILGVVLNRAESMPQEGYYAYNYTGSSHLRSPSEGP